MIKKIKFILAAAILFFNSANAFGAEIIDIDIGNVDDPRVMLGELKFKVNKAFQKIEAELSAGAKELSTVGISGTEARQILKNLYNGKTDVVEYATTSPDGILTTIEPGSLKEFEGSNINEQAHVARMLQTKKPVVSEVFHSVEGVNTIDFAYPIFSPDNQFIGSLNVLIKYEDIFSPIILPVVHSRPFDVWIIQKDGLTLYDPDKEEIGKNVFNDPLYEAFPSYVALCRRIAEEPTGFGSYNFLNKGLEKSVNKDAAWATIGMHGVEWRMVVVRERRST